MNNHQELILNYLKDVCRHTQWHDNLMVLAPFDRTPYLLNVSKVGLAALALDFPGMKIWEVIASPPAGIRSKRHIDWAAEHDGVIYTIEGVSSLEDLELILQKRAMISMLGEQVEIHIEKNLVSPDRLASFLDSSDAVILKVNKVAQKAFSEHVSADIIDQHTVQSIGIPKRRTL